jgi:thioredoxin reductase (NADPH)
MITPDELKPFPIFACLTDAQRLRIVQNAADINLQKGEWLIREGEIPWFFVLIEGSLDMEKEYGGSGKIRGRYQPGDFYGETPILLDSLTIASLRAREPSRVIRLDRVMFKELIGASAECTRLIVQTMMKRVTATREYVLENDPLRVLVVGKPHDPDCRSVRTFLSTNRIPYEWVDSERDPDRVTLCMPANFVGAFAIVDGNNCIGEPLTVRKVADALGLRTSPANSDYDVLVVGGGPTGLAAAVYGASEGLRVALIERNAVGGQAGSSSRIENYLGFPNGISGDELSTRALRQAIRFGAEIVMTRSAEKLEPVEGGYEVHLDGDIRVRTRTVVLATGVEWRRLEAQGIDRLQGKGVLYGASRTEAQTVIGKRVFIVGGGNSAGQAAMFFSGYAASVTLLVRGTGLERSMSQYLIAQLAQRRNIFVETHTKVVSVEGDAYLDSIVTVGNDEQPCTRAADALFLMIGAKAKNNWLPMELERDEHGFIYTGRDIANWSQARPPFLLETSMPGVFCAGDVRHNSIQRVSSGVGEGSMAIAFVHQYLSTENEIDRKAVVRTTTPFS